MKTRIIVGSTADLMPDYKKRVNIVRYTTVGSVIGTHAGPGAVVVAFFKK